MEARFFDGEVARPRWVDLAFTESGLGISEGALRLASWPYDRIRLRGDGTQDALRLGLADPHARARLEIIDPIAKAEVRVRCRHLSQGDIGRVGVIVAWSMAAVASLVLCTVYLVPAVADRAAPLVPASFERRLGTAVDNQVRLLLGAETCATEEGAAALAQLVTRLSGAAPGAVEADVQVLDSTVPNALALPGGRIYLLAGLLDRAESADEIAGVVAHEMGHVVRRDGMRRLIQTGSTSFLLGLLFGDVAGSGTLILLGRLAVDASYSREAERAADRFAGETLSALGRPARPLAQLLSRIERKSGAAPSLLDSHPLTAERLAALSEDSATVGEPLLSTREWAALKAICAARGSAISP